jgi:hypothetical protein
LYEPQNIADDIDAVSAATLKSGKLVYALRDGLLRGDVSGTAAEQDDTQVGFYDPPSAEETPEDGTYRGFYYQDGTEWIAVQFTLTDGAYSSVSFRRLAWQDGDYLSDSATEKQTEDAMVFRYAAQALIGHRVQDTTAVCTAATGQVDGVSSATARTDLLALAVLNGLNHGPFRLAMDSVLPEEETYKDGSYTALCKEDGGLLFQAHFALKEGKFAAFEVREAADEWAEAAEKYAEFLSGRDVSALDRLPAAFSGDEKAYRFCAAVWESLAK